MILDSIFMIFLSQQYMYPSNRYSKDIATVFTWLLYIISTKEIPVLPNHLKLRRYWNVLPKPVT